MIEREGERENKVGKNVRVLNLERVGWFLNVS